jgi:DNA gyrase subunit A
MKFRRGDELLSMSIIRSDAGEDDLYVFTVTDGGFAKRTAVSEYREQGRGGLGIKAMKLNSERGSLVGGLVVSENDEVIAIKASGQITRSAVTEVPVKGRDTMGVKFVGVRDNDTVVAIALNPEITAEESDAEPESEGEVAPGDGSEAGEPTAEDRAPADPEPPAPGVEEDEQ